MKFKYVAYDKEGKKIKSTIEAIDIEDAKNKLSHLYVLEIKPTKIDFHIGKVKKQEIAKILRVLGLYLKASIPLKKAINLTSKQTQNQRLQKFLSFVEKEIENGKTLYDAISNQKIVKLPEFVIYSIQIAQKSSNLDLILIKLANFLEEEEKITSKSTQAMIYPLFVIFISLFLVIFMMNTIVPKIIQIFQNLNQSLPLITKITISVSEFIQNHLFLIVGISFLIVSLITISYKKITFFKKFIHSLILKIPLLKELTISKNIGRFTSLTYTLTNSGINFVNAISLASKTIDNLILKEKLQKSLNDVNEGKKLSTALKKYNFPDENLIEAISLIEESGETKEILKNFSEIYLNEYSTKVSILISLLEPMMILIVGAIIGFIVVSMLLPIFSMSVIK